MIHRLVLALITLAGAAACRAEAQAQPRDCSVRPAGFYRARDDRFWSGVGDLLDRPHVNQVSVARNGSLRWNGTPIDYATLDRYRATVREMDPPPWTVLNFPSGAPCRAIVRVRAAMQRRLHCSAEKLCLQDDWKAYIRSLSHR